MGAFTPDVMTVIMRSRPALAPETTATRPERSIRIASLLFSAVTCARGAAAGRASPVLTAAISFDSGDSRFLFG
jgi:hypothetical protein